MVKASSAPPGTWPGSRLVAAGCAALALAMLLGSWLRLSGNVGHSTFLADQIDQLQQFELLAKGDPDGLYGPFWSGTAPQVFGFGPLSNLAFGLPSLLGLNPDQGHLVLLGLMVAGVAFFYFSVSRFSPPLALLWTALILASPSVWWIGSKYWANLLLVPISLLFAAGAVAYAHTRSYDSALWLLVWLFLGFQVHATPGIVFLLMAAVACDQWRRWRARPFSLRPSRRVLAGLAVILGPYLVAEALTGARNTHALWDNLCRGGSRARGGQGVREALLAVPRLLGLDKNPPRDLNLIAALWWLALAALLLGGLALGLLAVRRLRQRNEQADDLLALAALLVISGQTIFFLVVNRTVVSRHYLLWGLPWVVLPVALVCNRLARRLGRSGLVLVLVASLGVYLAGWTRAERWFARTGWNWQQTTSGLAQLCQEYPILRLKEPGTFVCFNPKMDTVVHYLSRRWVPGCNFSNEAPVLLHPGRRRAPPETLTVDGVKWRRTRLYPPGFGIYRLE